MNEKLKKELGWLVDDNFWFLFETYHSKLVQDNWQTFIEKTERIFLDKFNYWKNFKNPNDIVKK